jgi:hypothetical protein
MNCEKFERDTAIASNCYHLEKWNNEAPILDGYEEIIKAAKWNYRRFGFGYVSLDKYLDHKESKLTKRLYNIDVKEWYRLLKIVFKRDNYTCSYCGGIGGKLEADHKIPISKGGTNELSNLTTSCRRCNRQKKDKSVADFLAWRVEVYG